MTNVMTMVGLKVCKAGWGKTLGGLSCCVVLLGLASCNSTSNASVFSDGPPPTLANEAVRENPTSDSNQELLPEELSAAPQEILAQGTSDPEVEALREEALETAIADGNLTHLASNCRMGECVESYYTFTTLVRQAGDERLHSTEVITFQVNMESSEPGRWVLLPAETLVLCSTQRPLVIYQEEGNYTLDHIAPGEYPPGFAFESDSLYWAICHDVDVLQLSAAARAEQAAELGYGPELEPQQTQTTFLELFEG